MSTTRRLTRLIGSVGLLAALMLPTGALAAPSSHISVHQLAVGADFATQDLVASVHFTVVDRSQGQAAIQIWAPAERFYAGEPPTIVAGDAQLTASDDARLSGSVDLHLGATGAFLGQLVVDLSVAPSGEPQQSETSQIGNHKIRIEQTVQPMSASGTLALPGSLGTLDLAAAYAVNASLTEVEEFSNDPSSTVASLDFVGMLKIWQVDGMTVMVVGNSDRLLTYVDAAIIMPDGSILNGVQDGATFGRQAIAADVPLASPGGEGFAATGGTLSVRADVANGDRTSYVTEDGDAQTRVTVQDLVAHGTVEIGLDDGTSVTLDFADASGSFYDWSERLIDGGR